MVFGDIGSEWGGTGWYLVVLGQYRVVLVDIWWYLGQYRAVPIGLEVIWDQKTSDFLVYDLQLLYKYGHWDFSFRIEGGSQVRSSCPK